MGRIHLDWLAVGWLAACLPATAPAEQPTVTVVPPAPAVPIPTVPPAPPLRPTSAPPPPAPALPAPRREPLPPLVDAGSLDGFPDYRVAPWWTPPPTPPPRPTAAIAQALPRIRRALRRCYDHSLKSDPDMHGQLTIRFTVGRDGQVVSVDTRQHPSLDGVARCIRGALRHLPFPPQDQPVEISVPVLFVAAASQTP